MRVNVVVASILYLQEQKERERADLMASNNRDVEAVPLVRNGGSQGGFKP